MKERLLALTLALRCLNACRMLKDLKDFLKFQLLALHFRYVCCSYDSLSSYGQSKLANVLHSNELARRLKVVTYINYLIVRKLLNEHTHKTVHYHEVPSKSIILLCKSISTYPS